MNAFSEYQDDMFELPTVHLETETGGLEDPLGPAVSGPINGGRSGSDGSGSAFCESTASNPASSCERYLRTL